MITATSQTKNETTFKSGVAFDDKVADRAVSIYLTTTLMIDGFGGLIGIAPRKNTSIQLHLVILDTDPNLVERLGRSIVPSSIFFGMDLLLTII